MNNDAPVSTQPPFWGPASGTSSISEPLAVCSPRPSQDV